MHVNTHMFSMSAAQTSTAAVVQRRRRKEPRSETPLTVKVGDLAHICTYAKSHPNHDINRTIMACLLFLSQSVVKI